MLSSLRIKNYFLIDSLDIQFPEGLVIITGQTGAGKSILIGALRLALGAKADASSIAEGAETCTIEAEFSSPDPALKAIFVEEDGEWDDSCLIVRRVLSRSGRSRCFINDCPASQAFLSRISAHLLDIHSQHQNLLLNDRHFQMSLLDYFAGNATLLADYTQCYEQCQQLAARVAALEKEINSADDEREYRQMQWERLDKASLRAGEMADLEEEERLLSNSEQIKSLFTTTLAALSDGSDGSGAGSGFSSGSGAGFDSLDARLRCAEKELRRLSAFYPECSEMAERLESSRLEIEDIAQEIEDRNALLEDSSSRLEQVQERLSLLQGLLRKYSCANEDELIAFRDSLSARLSDTGALEIEYNALCKELKKQQESLLALAHQLHQARVDAASPLSEAITRSIRSLELEYAQFVVQIKAPSDAAASQCGPKGYDQVSFLFSANGTKLEDVSKCASGGEMSRIMLSLKDMMARYAQMPTMIFDEIDSGVSGSVADRMGSMICAMGENMQVFAITHLPQVAAKGKAHYLVSKNFESDPSNPSAHRAVSTLKRLNADERIQEVARMLSGSTLTPEAIENAKVLLRV